LFKQALAIVIKDLRVEFRTRYALNALFMFALVTLAAVSYTTSQAQMDKTLFAALLWIVLFFSAMTGMARSFVVEEDSHTAPLLRLAAGGMVVYWGKLLVNLLLLLSLAIVTLPLFIFLMGAPAGSLGVQALAICLGVIGLAGGSTIVAAIVAQSVSRGALFTVLSFPVLLPILALSIQISAVAFGGGSLAEVTTHAVGLVSYSGAMITASSMLFEYVWR
jgi:heme exporter protein B